MAGLIGLAPLLIFAIAWLALGVFLRRRRKAGWVYLLLFTIFGIYLYGVLHYTLLQFQSLLVLKLVQPGIIIRGIEAAQSINLVPLVGLTGADLQTSLLNILMLVPFGFGLPLLTDFRFAKVVAAGALFSLAIECLQWATGYLANATFRVADINDLIFNTIGAALGYLLFAALLRLARGALRTRNVSNPLLLHILQRPHLSA